MKVRHSSAPQLMAQKGKTRILAVTVLTSLSKCNMQEIGITSELQDPLKLVLYRAGLAKKAGCTGVVCSGKEVKAVKEKFGRDFITVVPGVRPTWSQVSNDDQARVVTPFDAIRDGADYIVVGRPIRNAQDPKAAAQKVADEIQEAMKKTIIAIELSLFSRYHFLFCLLEKNPHSLIPLLIHSINNSAISFLENLLKSFGKLHK
jgi:orotidine-5'-phosphate decarboxylase